MVSNLAKRAYPVKVGRAGFYSVTASVNPSAAASFQLSQSAPLRVQEGGGLTLAVPPGIAFTEALYLPLVTR